MKRFSLTLALIVASMGCKDSYHMELDEMDETLNSPSYESPDKQPSGFNMWPVASDPTDLEDRIKSNDAARNDLHERRKAEEITQLEEELELEKLTIYGKVLTFTGTVRKTSLSRRIMYPGSHAAAIEILPLEEDSPVEVVKAEFPDPERYTRIREGDTIRVTIEITRSGVKSPGPRTVLAEGLSLEVISRAGDKW